MSENLEDNTPGGEHQNFGQCSLQGMFDPTLSFLRWPERKKETVLGIHSNFTSGKKVWYSHALHFAKGTYVGSIANMVKLKVTTPIM